MILSYDAISIGTEDNEPLQILVKNTVTGNLNNKMKCKFKKKAIFSNTIIVYSCIYTDYYMGIPILAWLSSRDLQYGSRDDNQANMEMPMY